MLGHEDGEEELVKMSQGQKRMLKWSQSRLIEYAFT